MSKINDNIIKAIEILVEQKLEKLKCTEVFKSVILGKNTNGTYRINYNNHEHNIKSGLAVDDLKVGQMVWVTIPSGEFREMYISGIVR